MKWGIERSKILTSMSGLPVCGGMIRRTYDHYLRQKYHFNWRWGGNPASGRLFQESPPTLNKQQERIVDQLFANGVAICQFEELFHDAELWRTLCAHVSEFSNSDEVQSLICQQGEEFRKTNDVRTVQHYIITKYPQDRKPLITANNPLLKLGLNPLILDIVNSYLRLWSKLIYFDMWRTLPLDTDTRFLSQRWHRDPEDRRKIRIFLYFSDVDKEAGAMVYLSGSHCGGPYQNVFPWEDPLGIPYPPDGEVERQIPVSQHTVLAGRAGTLIFCDTAGFHRGGPSRSKPRILATAAFVTPASLHRRRYYTDSTIPSPSWSAAAKYAVM